MVNPFRRQQHPSEAWSVDAGRVLGRAFAAAGHSTTLTGRTVGPTFVLFEFIPNPPTPANYAALAKFAPTVRRLLQVEQANIQERGGRVIVRVPNPRPWALDHRAVEGDGLDAPLGLADTGEWDGVDFAHSPHLGVFGASGEGKTTLVRGLLYHLTRQNDPAELRLFVVARDLADWRSVEAVPHSWGLVRHADALPVVRWLAREAERREHWSETTPRIVVVIDDCVTLIQRAPEVGAHLDGLASQARHAGVHLVVVSQAATREGTGSAILLKNLTRRYVFGSASAAEAAYSTGRADTGAQYLAKGEAVSVDGRVTRIVSIPNVTADMPFEPRPGWRAVAPWEADRLATPPGAVAPGVQEPMPPSNVIEFRRPVSGVSPISTYETTPEAPESAQKPPATEGLTPLIALTEREKRMTALLREHKSAHEIAVTLTGQKGGPTYQACVREVKELIVRILQEAV